MCRNLMHCLDIAYQMEIVPLSKAFPCRSEDMQDAEFIFFLF